MSARRSSAVKKLTFLGVQKGLKDTRTKSSKKFMRIDGNVLFKGGLRGIVRSKVQDIIAIPRKLTATEKVLEPGLKDRWAHMKFKSRFPASPRRCTQIISETPKASYRASSELATIDERMNQTIDI